LFLPRSFEEPAQPREPSVAAAADAPAGTVLLVEDNDEVAAVARSYFEQLGYKIKEAASGQTGLDLIESDSAIELVFSDILMPGGMNGLDLAETVRRRFPDIVVLLTTGYSSSVQDAVRQGFEVLQKPYDLASLQRALRAARKAAAGACGRHTAPQPQHVAG